MNEKIKEAHRAVLGLLDKYDNHRQAYRSPQYSEAQARQDFIDKFLTAFGWDVGHNHQTNPFEQEVKVERNTDSGKTQRRADFAFFLGPNFRDVRFFVEAKKPSAELETQDNYFQVIRYGWNSRTPFAFLTNFEALHVLDCRYKPDIDSALDCSLRKFHYSELRNPEIFAEAYWLLSREALATGAFDRFAENLPGKRGKAVQRGLFKGGIQTIDEAFLEELDGYRDALARSLKAKNQRLDGQTLTEVTQRVLDRLVFLRFLEDKLIETQASVGGFGDKGTVWGDFVAASRRLDGIYNGIVFKNHPLIDGRSINVDEKVFGEICEDLSAVNSPYNFDAIPIHILGSIYERFLGKVIVVTDKRAHVEEKLEVRKAGGVYYTPVYVVRHIVERTIGRLIEGKQPGQIDRMRFADVSCGSGSFLLGVYDYLLQYNQTWFNANRSKVRKGDCVEHEDGTLHLSLKRKREILVNCVYGVDIDSQAVEVAQLALYLKLLEEETTASARNYQLELHETLLPSLSKNIVCGNSLVEPDILEGKLFESEEERALSPLNLREAMRESAGIEGEDKQKHFEGFDAIVGNPPWGAVSSKVAQEYFRRRYRNVIARMTDSYIFFIDRSIDLVKPGGYVGLIVPGTLQNQTDARPIRQRLIQHGLREVVNLGQGVFGNKVLNTSTIVIAGGQVEEQVTVDDLSAVPPANKDDALAKVRTQPRKVWEKVVRSDPNVTLFASENYAPTLLAKLSKKFEPLSTYLKGGIQRGVTPDVVGAHVLSSELAKSLHIEREILRPSVTGDQIKPFAQWKSNQSIIYLTRDDDIRKYPKALAHIEQYRKIITCPEVKEKKHPWWSLHRPRSESIFESPKIIGLTTTKIISVIYDESDNLVVTDAMYVFTLKHGINPWAAMAVLQSKVFLYLYRVSNQGEARVIPQVKASKLEPLPFPDLTRNTPLIAALTESAKQLFKTTAEMQKTLTQKDMNYCERRFAELTLKTEDIVSELYSLTKPERASIEEALVK